MAARESGDRSPEKTFPYRCFLVRCRLEENAGPTGQPAWRFTVQQAGERGARHSFTCFDNVAAHMRTELASCGAPAGDAAESIPIVGAALRGCPTSEAAAEGRTNNGVQERR